jgi:hypothetical protein
MAEQQEIRECPYCKEEIKAEAIKCKHCGSRVTPERPGHEGVCPFCKEEIHPEAIKCKHCKSTLTGDADCGCGEGGAGFPRELEEPFGPQGGVSAGAQMMRLSTGGLGWDEEACYKACKEAGRSAEKCFNCCYLRWDDCSPRNIPTVSSNVFLR